MKKLLITLLISIFLLTGCTIIKISDSSVNEILETVLFVDNKLSNTFFTGYKLYLPQGVKVIDKKEYNIKIKDNLTYYYLYIDTIAYHYQTNNTYTVNDGHFYSQKITNNGLTGYVDIEEVNNKYFVVLMYNYAKIEAYVPKKDFNETFINMCYILSTIEFNDKVIDNYIGEKGFSFQEEDFDIFSSKRENDNFLTYEEEYGVYKDDKNKIDGSSDDVVEVETIE